MNFPVKAVFDSLKYTLPFNRDRAYLNHFSKTMTERRSRGASAEFRTCLLSLRTPKEGSGFGEWVKETLPLLPVPRAVGAFSQPNISVATIENWYYSLSFHQLWGNAVLPRDASYFKAGTDNLSKKRI